ncbi:nucleoside recognition domain-containing protein [Uliginosibacterium paludis]|uniref:Nucleoside recognition domain-containing protein n=1 Tax=Uliginosibacterium paludis TaxID=1615952 RepID=A0ABV2CRI9_9RHOO
MILNIVWLGFFFLAFLACLYQWLVNGDSAIFSRVLQESFTMSKTAFDISLGLTGVLTFWLGVLRVGEQAGAVAWLARLVNPLFCRLFPEVPAGHPAQGAMLLNIGANLLGLDNAATPMGLKAMRALQELNPDPDRASNAQILFLVLNASGLTLIPVSIMTYRAQLGAANPADVFLPILLATFFSTLAGLLAVAWMQKIRLHQPVVLAWLLGLCSAVGATLLYFARLTAEQMAAQSAFVSGLVLFGVIVAFLALASWRRISAFDAFIEGAREGFNTAVMVIPYLVAILVGIAVFRASGAMDLLMSGLTALLGCFGVPADVGPALPTALMKPLSGSGARGMMIDAMKTYGADSFAGRLACMFQGAADTTFYIVAVYFGAVGVRKTRYTVPCCLIADLVGVVAAIAIALLFFAP